MLIKNPYLLCNSEWLFLARKHWHLSIIVATLWYSNYIYSVQVQHDGRPLPHELRRRTERRLPPTDTNAGAILMPADVVNKNCNNYIFYHLTIKSIWCFAMLKIAILNCTDGRLSITHPMLLSVGFKNQIGVQTNLPIDKIKLISTIAFF